VRRKPPSIARRPHFDCAPLQLRPTASAIVLNESLVEGGKTREAAFSRILRHSAFVGAVSRGTIPVWMP
jgi:hypothetical protein